MQAECNDIFSRLESWYAGDNGCYLLEATRNATQDLLDNAFGYHILQLGVHGDRPLHAGSRINHQVYCSEHPGEGVQLIAGAGELPLESDSIDVVVAHHCLEFVDHPHQVLREIQRVLTPQGQLVLIGFNPFSLHGVGAWFRGLLRDPLWRAHRPVGELRLTDWLRLLGCEVNQTMRLYGMPPVGSGRLRGALVNLDTWSARHNLPGNGLYVIHATKQVAGLHPPQRALRSRRGRLIGLVPKPAAAPTPITPAPRSSYNFDKGSIRY